jgi:outer membrane protein
MKCKTTIPVIALFAAIGFSPRTQAQVLTLENAIREVCTNSDSVKMMNQSVFKADQMVREKWANALPLVSATGAYVHNYGSAVGGSGSSGSQTRPMGKALSEFTPADSGLLANIGSMLSEFSDISQPANTDVYSAGISINQPIYTFGKIGEAINVAKNFNKSAKASYARNMQTLQLGALDIFFTTMIAQRAADIAERSLARKKELNAFLERNFKNGAGSKAQVLKTRADVADQEAQAIGSRRNAKVVMMNLNAMMGTALTDSIPLDTITLIPQLAAMTIPAPTDAVQSALSDRADIKSINFLAASTKGGAKIYRSMYLPTIGATGSAGYTRMDSDSKLIGKNNCNPNYSIGVGASWTLFDGFANSAKAAQYQSDATKLDIVASTMSKMVEIEVRSAILECSAADSNIVSSREMYKAAQEGYDLTSSNFKQGSGQFADVQLADETLQQAELGVTNAKYRQIRSRAALLVAMGRDIVKIK